MEQSFITSSGDRLSLRLQPGTRLGAGGQGQVFRTSLGGTPVAVVMVPVLALLPPAPSGASMTALPPHARRITGNPT